MIQLGKFQDLYIVKRKDFGVYVNDQKDVTEGSILLPAKQVPEHAKIGDKISCFVYKDSSDCNRSYSKDHFRCDPSTPRQRSQQDRCLSGLGFRKRSVSSF